MIYPLAWPSLLVPSSESWVPENFDRSGGAGIDGSEQIVSSGGGRWRARLTFQLLSAAEAQAMRAMILGLRGRYGTVRIGPFDLSGQPQPGLEPPFVSAGLLNPTQDGPPFQKGTANTVISGSAALRATSIVLRTNGGFRPSPGNYIGVGARLHVIVATTNGGSSTDTTCEIEPPLRSAYSDGTAVTFTEMVCVMRLAAKIDALELSAATPLRSVALDLVEAF